MHSTSSECPPQFVRRRKSAAERRAQQLRSDTRALQRLLSGLHELHTHRGSSLCMVGVQLRGLIMHHVASPDAAAVPMPVFRGSEDRKRKREEGEQQPGEASGSFPAVLRAAFARAKGVSGQAVAGVQLQQVSGMGRGKGTHGPGSEEARILRRGFKIRKPPKHLASKAVALILNASCDEEEDRMRDAWNSYCVGLLHGKMPIPSFLLQE